MPQSTDICDKDLVAKLESDLRHLSQRIDRQKQLEIQLNETLHSLRVHQEELRTQNDDLIAAQREISQSQRKYRDLFDFAPTGYFIINANGTIQEANLTAARMIGRHRRFIDGKPLFLFIAPPCRKMLEVHLRELWQGRPASAELALIQKDDTFLPVALFGVPVTDDQRQIVQGRIAVTDISKRQEAEALLKESERQMDTIIKNIPDIVFRLDQNGMINFISESVRRYGYTPGDLVGQPMIDLIHPQDRAKAQHRIQERRTGERSTTGLEIRLIDKPANKPSEQADETDDRFFMVSAEGLYENEQCTSQYFVGTQGIAHDITGHKQIEWERRQLEAELHKARKLEAVGTLAGGIAHDFNNLLMGIQGSASLMRLDHQRRSGDMEQFLQRIEIIEQCVKRGSELTKQLLGFAKRGKYNVKTIDLNQIVTETADLFARTHKGVEIRQVLDPTAWLVDADKGQLEQVLLNILINADQAMPMGGQIALATENIYEEELQGRRLGLKPGNYLRIRIKDSGLGMDQEIQNRIFEPFFTTKPVGEGTGLGLASAYGIVKNHGGTIVVESDPGQGSCFTIYLPASNGAVAPVFKASEGIIHGRGTILLVDDEQLIADVAAKMLERLKYKVLIATDGASAESIYRQRHEEIDLVILDMIMPRMSGFETYGRIKAINPDIKVILSSGYSKEGQADEIVVRDKQDFLHKPFDLALLSQAVDKIINR